MIHFAWPLSILLLPLPWLIRKVMPPINPSEQAALIVPFLEDFTATTSNPTGSSRTWPLIFASIAWCLLVIATTRPQWLGEPIEQGVSGRDLMLAVDLSGSMEEQDFIINNRRVNRLTATKKVAGEFINRRIGDRIGLILFGTQAYLQTPLTFDRQTVLTLLNESALGLAGDNTAIGDAIGLAVKRLRQQTTGSRVLILLTDGANTAGEITPIKAAELAAENQLKIYTIGIGADAMQMRTLFGGTYMVNPSKDLDEDTLTVIADKTGGSYFRARNTEQLNQIYQILDQLEPVEKDKRFFRPRAELFHWPLGLALCLAAGVRLNRMRWS